MHGTYKRIRTLLHERRQRLLKDMQLRIERIREKGSLPTHTEELDTDDGCDLDVQLLEITAATLRDLDHAIERLDAGRYGRCSRCRAPISEARLLALPSAVYCQGCETAREGEIARDRAQFRSRVPAEGHVA